MQVTSLTHRHFNNLAFNAIIVPDDSVRKNLLKGLNFDELNEIKNVFLQENQNPVCAYIHKNDFSQLTANLYCPYYLKNFKENYKQIPLFESKLGFIKRIANICEKYREQLL